MPEKISHIGIIGGGRMGTDIFNFLSLHDITLSWVSLTEGKDRSLMKAFEKRLARKCKNGLLSQEECGRAGERVSISCDIADLADCDLVIECIIENADAKSRLFTELDAVTDKDAIFATNSSSLLPSDLWGNSGRKDRFIGLHFIYPVMYRDIVEVIVTVQTRPEVLSAVKSFLAAAGRFHIVVDEKEGSLLNRMLLDLQAQAFRIYREGSMTVREIDDLVSTRFMPAGVFSFFDGVGINVMLDSITRYVDEMNDKDFYRPMLTVLQGMSGAGSSAQGFYTGDEKYLHNRHKTVSSPELRERTADLLMALYINSFFKTVEKGVCSPADLDYAAKEYTASEKGPLDLLDIYGWKGITEILAEYYRDTGHEAFKVSPQLRNRGSEV